MRALTHITVYGLPHCDTVKRTRAWLVSQSLAHRCVDFRPAGVPADRLDAWLATCSWQAVLNRRGTTWRKLDAATQAGVVDAASVRACVRACGDAGAAQCCQAPSSAVNRPMVEWADGAVAVGFDAQAWAQRQGHR